MIDSFSLLLSHGLLLIAFWRLLSRPDLDREEFTDQPTPDPVESPRKEQDTIFPHA